MFQNYSPYIFLYFIGQQSYRIELFVALCHLIKRCSIIRAIIYHCPILDTIHHPVGCFSTIQHLYHSICVVFFIITVLVEIIIGINAPSFLIYISTLHIFLVNEIIIVKTLVKLPNFIGLLFYGIYYPNLLESFLNDNA